MKFYYHPASTNCRRVLATIYDNKLEEQMEMVLVDLLKGAHREPGFLAINPNGKVPALVDGNQTLWESTAIMQYLSQDSPLWPKSNARYDIVRWQSWGLAHWSNAIGTVVFERLVKALMNLGEPDENVVQKGLAEFDRFARVLDGHLEGRQWVVDESITLADYSLAANLTYAQPVELPVASFGNISRWYAQIEERDAWKRSAPPAH